VHFFGLYCTIILQCTVHKICKISGRIAGVLGDIFTTLFYERTQTVTNSTGTTDSTHWQVYLGKPNQCTQCA